ncbi:MAG: hypothetical protein AAGG47_14840 [Pseudomonadota bacterium]
MLGHLAARCLLALALGAGSAQSATLFLTDQFGSDLFTFDTDTGTTTLVGNIGFGISGLALAPSGDLFGITTGNAFISIDTSSGAGTVIGTSTVSSFPEGLAFAPDGTLFASGGEALFTIDPLTGVATELGAIDLFDLDGLTVTQGPVTTAVGTFGAGTILAADSGGLFAIDPGTLAVTLIGSPTNSVPQEALTVLPDGTLFGADSILDAVFLIDLVTLVSTQVGPPTGLELIGGLTGPVAPPGTVVPLPAGLPLALAGLLSLAWVGRRRG